MKIMLTLQGDDDSAPIDSYLASLGAEVKVLAFERLDPDEAATLSQQGDGPPIVTREGSALRAVWILDAASRQAAVEIARGAPGGAGVLEVREAFTPQDFGAPPSDAPPPPAPPRKPGTHRFIAFIRSDPHSEAGEMPSAEVVAAMGVYCEKLLADHTMIGGQGLKASARGTRVRRSAAQRFILDGPFTETKELVAGYMLLQVPSLDDAVDAVRGWLQVHLDHIRAPHTAIEVRRLLSA
ncbi:MAG TPA: YciI family protein [Kofleriaceae bacterium]